MTTDDTVRLAEIRTNFYADRIRANDMRWLLDELADALERERVLIENQARLKEGLRDCLMALEHEGIHAKRIAKLLSEIEGGE